MSHETPYSYEAFQKLLDSHETMTIAVRVQLSPSVVDTRIVAATQRAATCYGYQDPVGLEGQFTSMVHVLEDIQRTRLRSTLRALGLAEPLEHYEVRIIQQSGEIKRVIKHVEQRQVDGIMVWISCLEPANPRTIFHPPELPTTVPEDALHHFFGWACVAEVEALVRYQRLMGMSLISKLFHSRTIEPEALQAISRHGPAPPDAQIRACGSTLKMIRKTRQWSLRQTVEQLFHQTGVRITRQYLSKVEREEVTPSPPLLEALAATLQQPALLPSDSETESRRQERPSTPPWRDHLHQATQKLLIAEQARTRALAAAHEAGLSLREIATATGLSPSGVRKLINAPQGTDPD